MYGGEVTAHVEIPTTGMSASAGTVAVWGYLAEPQPAQTRYFFGHTTQPAYSSRVQLYMDGGNTELDLGLGDSHTTRTNIMILETETWYHVALTWDSGDYVVYVNGEVVAEGTYTGLSTIHPFAWIGNDGNPVTEGTEAFGGLLDEVRLYDRALGAEEILAAMKVAAFPFSSGPEPKDGIRLEATWADLSWRAGDFAVSHDLYMGTNFDDVNAGVEGTFQGNTVDTFFLVGFPGFPFPGGLQAGTTYYWRVDEVNAASADSPWTGSVWSFTTADVIVVDNFEGYTNEVGQRVFQTWLDGLGYTEPPPGNPGNGTGARVGYDPLAGEIMEMSIVHGGRQAMPMDYNNVDPPYYSEAERTWATPQDWTVNGVDTLTLYVRGMATNGPGSLYVALQDSAGRVADVPHADPAAVTAVEWLKWSIPLADFTDVNPSGMTKMYIGVGDRDAPTPGGVGSLYIDDIGVLKKPVTE